MQEQRRYERVAFFCPLELSVLPAGPTVPGYSIDVSIGGVGLTAKISLKRGQLVRISFRLNNGAGEKTTEAVAGRVAFSQADEDGDRIGVEFVELVQESRQPVLARTINSL